MTKTRNDLQPEPTHARGVLAQLVRAGVGVELAAVVFVGRERAACWWLLSKGLARRSRARVSGQLTYAATDKGRAQHEAWQLEAQTARKTGAR